MKLAYATLALPLVILVAAASDRPAAGSQKEDQQNLEDANRRWRGARCRSRVPLEVKKGRANDGWTNCGILYWGDGGNKRVRVRVSDADAVRRRFSGGTIPIGTDFVASGWEVEEDGGTLFLEIELQGLPVRAKVYFGDSWVGRVGVNRITDFERWARFEFMEVLSTPAEQLVAVPSASTMPQPTAPAISVDRHAPAAATLRVLAASVEPSRVAPGDEVRLTVIYTVAGLVRGTAVSVAESRTILRDGATLTTIEASALRESGTHQSSQPLQLPAVLAEGVYELRVAVELGGNVEIGSAMFQVVSGGP